MILISATPDHAAAMAGAHAASFATGWSAADIAACLASPGGYGLIAAQTPATPDVGGFVLARVIVGEAEILTLAVTPAFRRRGIARALLEGAAGLAESLGGAAMFLEVASDNSAAIALYEQFGFRTAGLRRGYYRRAGGRAQDALVLRSDLNRARA